MTEPEIRPLPPGLTLIRYRPPEFFICWQNSARPILPRAGTIWHLAVPLVPPLKMSIHRGEERRERGGKEGGREGGRGVRDRGKVWVNGERQGREEAIADMREGWEG
jgi:hypothetical protein